MSDRQFPEASFAAPFPAKPKLDQKHTGLSAAVPANSRDGGLSGERTAILPPDSKQNCVLRSDYYQEGVHGDFLPGTPGPSVLSLPETKGSMAEAETEAKRISQDYSDTLKGVKNQRLAKFIAQHKFDPKYQAIWPLVAKTLREKYSPQALCRFLDDLIEKPHELVPIQEWTLWLRCLDAARLPKEWRHTSALLKALGTWTQQLMKNRSTLKDHWISMLQMNPHVANSPLFQEPLLQLLREGQAQCSLVDLLMIQPSARMFAHISEFHRLKIKKYFLERQQRAEDTCKDSELLPALKSLFLETASLQASTKSGIAGLLADSISTDSQTISSQPRNALVVLLRQCWGDLQSDDAEKRENAATLLGILTFHARKFNQQLLPDNLENCFKLIFDLLHPSRNLPEQEPYSCCTSLLIESANNSSDMIQRQLFIALLSQPELMSDFYFNRFKVRIKVSERNQAWFIDKLFKLVPLNEEVDIEDETAMEFLDFISGISSSSSVAVQKQFMTGMLQIVNKAKNPTLVMAAIELLGSYAKTTEHITPIHLENCITALLNAIDKVLRAKNYEFSEQAIKALQYFFKYKNIDPAQAIHIKRVLMKLMDPSLPYTRTKRLALQTFSELYVCSENFAISKERETYIDFLVRLLKHANGIEIEVLKVLNKVDLPTYRRKEMVPLFFSLLKAQKGDEYWEYVVRVLGKCVAPDTKEQAEYINYLLEILTHPEHPKKCQIAMEMLNNGQKKIPSEKQAIFLEHLLRILNTPIGYDKNESERSLVSALNILAEWGKKLSAKQQEYVMSHFKNVIKNRDYFYAENRRTARNSLAKLCSIWVENPATFPQAVNGIAILAATGYLRASNDVIISNADGCFIKSSGNEHPDIAALLKFSSFDLPQPLKQEIAGILIKTLMVKQISLIEQPGGLKICAPTGESTLNLSSFAMAHLKQTLVAEYNRQLKGIPALQNFHASAGEKLFGISLSRQGYFASELTTGNAASVTMPSSSSAASSVISKPPGI